MVVSRLWSGWRQNFRVYVPDAGTVMDSGASTGVRTWRQGSFVSRRAKMLTVIVVPESVWSARTKPQHDSGVRQTTVAEIVCPLTDIDFMNSTPTGFGSGNFSSESVTHPDKKMEVTTLKNRRLLLLIDSTLDGLLAY